MLLHVVPPACGINQAPNPSSPLRRSVGLDIVHHPAILSLGDLGYAQLCGTPLPRGQPPCVVYLSAAGGIERGAIKVHTMAPIDFRRRNHFRDLAFKLVQKRIVIIEPVRHKHLSSRWSDGLPALSLPKGPLPSRRAGRRLSTLRWPLLRSYDPCDRARVW